MVSYDVTEKDSISLTLSHFVRRTGQETTPWDEHMSLERPTRSIRLLLAPVVQKVYSAIHWINQLVFVLLIRWIAIYPTVDSAMQLLNNRSLRVRKAKDRLVDKLRS